MKAKLITFLVACALFPKAMAEGEIKPFRTFISIQRYNMENNGETNALSETRLEVNFPNGTYVKLPENGGYWTIGNGQTQEINRLFEIPYSQVEKDGFKFSIQLYRKGSKMLPCNFEVSKLSEYNRGYVCHTDVSYQSERKVPQEKIDREGIQIRIFTDLNSAPKDIPQDSLASK